MKIEQHPFTAGGEAWLLLSEPGADTAAALQALAAFLPGRGWDAVELRCLPLDTPRHFDPVTLEGDAVGGPAVAVRSAALEQIGGQDTNLPREAALLDLSLRLRAKGGHLGCCPAAVVWVQPKPETAQDYAQQLAGRLLLARKYGTKAEAKAERARWQAELRAPSRHFDGVRKALLAAAPGVAAAWLRQKKCADAAWSEVCKDRTWRGVCPLVPFDKKPLVSVVVRTCGRPKVLCQSLRCLRNQTYRNFEVIVIEDGAPNSKADLDAQCADLPIRYYATGENVGRGRAGNIGIEHAAGEFVCFLDDDDYLYPEYIELNLSRFFDGVEKDLVLSSITAFEIEVRSRDPFDYTIHGMYPVIFDHLDLMDMCVKCRVPMTGAMFRRTLYEQHGGMREDIDGDEDWAMWLRYWRTARRADDTRPDIPRAVSMFGYPADPEQAAKRLAGYEVFDDIMLADPELRFTVPVEKARSWEKRLKGDLAHLHAHGGLEEFVRAARSDKAEWPHLPDEGEVTLTAQQINGWYNALLCRAAELMKKGELAQWLTT